jgi:hypothetical protein
VAPLDSMELHLISYLTKGKTRPISIADCPLKSVSANQYNVVLAVASRSRISPDEGEVYNRETLPSGRRGHVIGPTVTRSVLLALIVLTY